MVCSFPKGSIWFSLPHPPSLSQDGSSLKSEMTYTFQLIAIAFKVCSDCFQPRLYHVYIMCVYIPIYDVCICIYTLHIYIYILDDMYIYQIYDIISLQSGNQPILSPVFRQPGCGCSRGVLPWSRREGTQKKRAFFEGVAIGLLWDCYDFSEWG